MPVSLRPRTNKTKIPPPSSDDDISDRKPRKNTRKIVNKVVVEASQCQQFVNKQSMELVTAMKHRFTLEQNLARTEKQVKDLEKQIRDMDAKVVRLFSVMDGIVNKKTPSADIL